MKLLRKILPLALVLVMCMGAVAFVGDLDPVLSVDASDWSNASSAELEAVTEDLGPAFSSARVSYAIRMTVLGVGMIFAVLAMLWGIVAIFSAAMGHKLPKAEKVKEKPAPETQKPAPAPTPVPAPAPVPAGIDPAVVAAITAAIAETIAADPALAEQFAGGFRVVSFKRKSGKSSWNH